MAKTHLHHERAVYKGTSRPLILLIRIWQQIFHLCTKGNSGMRPPSSCFQFCNQFRWLMPPLVSGTLWARFTCIKLRGGFNSQRQWFLFVEVSCLVLVAPGVVFFTRAGVADGPTRPDQARGPGTAAQLKAAASRLPFDVTHHTLWCNTYWREGAFWHAQV